MLLVVSALSASLLAVQTPPSSAHISGHVFVEGANTPIAGARVTLVREQRPTFAPGPIMPAETSTDQDGQYSFQNVAPGNYRIQARRPGFAQNPERALQIVLAAGQAADDADIWLAQGGAISGRVLDPSGAPVIEAHIMLMRRLERPGVATRLFPAPTQGQQTNDLGEFRLYGIAAGTYYVLATTAPMIRGGGQAADAKTSRDATTLAPTFFPGTTDMAAAQAITVAAGSTVSEISFTMQNARAFRVSGIVVDGSGAPVSGAMVMLNGDPMTGVIGPAARANTATDGQFVIAGVTSGRYRLMASVPIIVSGPTGGRPATTGGVSGGVVGGVVYGSGAMVTSAVEGGQRTGGMNASPMPVSVENADVTGLRIVVAGR